jgi:hypothetical protein
MDNNVSKDSYDNLASRGMQPNPLCPLCDSGPEDAKHLLINCNFTREVIRLLWSWFHLQGSPRPVQWIRGLLSGCRRMQPELLGEIFEEQLECYCIAGGMCGRKGINASSTQCKGINFRLRSLLKRRLSFSSEPPWSSCRSFWPSSSYAFPPRRGISPLIFLSLAFLVCFLYSERLF